MKLKNLAALVIGLTMASTSLAQTNSSSQEELKQGTYTVNMESYYVKDGISLDTTTFGTYIGTKKVPLQLQSGGEEIGTYSVFSSGDNRPDLISVKNSEGKVISLMFDKNSPNYKSLVNSFADKIELW